MKKEINLLITGGIAAIKAKSLYDLLIADYDVNVIINESAKHFVSEDDIKVIDKIFDKEFYNTKTMGDHIKHTLTSALNIVYPATYEFIGKIANGMADDPCSLTFAASDFDTLLFPSMNNRMYENPIFIQNMDKLKNNPYIFWQDPVVGELASGHSGIGRAIEPIDVKAIVDNHFISLENLTNTKFLLNLGRTRSYIDKVRYITNESSGRMGISLLQQIKKITKNYNVVFGDNDFGLKESDNMFYANTNPKMLEEMQKHFNTSDIVVCAAAPYDFEVKNKSDVKLEKRSIHNDSLSLEFETAVDVLYELSLKKDNQFLVGFSLANSFDTEKALIKMKEKNMDMLILNLTSAMGSDYNEIHILSLDGSVKIVKQGLKDEIALEILKEINRQNKK